jgi:TonB family protein
MKPGLSFLDDVLSQKPAAAVPQFLVTLDPWYRVFFRNLWDLFIPGHSASPPAASSPAAFWPDVFVPSRWPWRGFSESVAIHAAAIVALVMAAHLWPQMPHLSIPVAFHGSDIVTYDLSQYLPPLDTGIKSDPPAQSGDPVAAPQTIISVPANADNRRQTIVTPPHLKLNQDVALPNIVAWEKPAPMIAPAATARTSDLRVPALEVPVIAPAPSVPRAQVGLAPALSESVIAPAPDVDSALSKRTVQGPQPAIVQPPPGVEMASLRQVSDIDIGRSPVIAPVPQLPEDERRSLNSLSRAPLPAARPSVVPPPPAVNNTGPDNAGRLIALNVRPSPPAAMVEVPNGNRRGTFAAGPQGKESASGAPDSPTGAKAASDSMPTTTSGKNLNGVPSGLFVSARPNLGGTSNISGPGDPPARPTSDPPVVASLSPARMVAAEVPAEQETEVERQIFAGRRPYAMTLNIPNLNSAAGSLVIHFSELQEKEKEGDLFAPVATRTVAPGYPIELMRENVQGTVTLSAVIHSDGQVGEVEILSGVDDRLDVYARNALLRWQFLPAMRNGKPVALQAVVRIPFKPKKTF